MAPPRSRPKGRLSRGGLAVAAAGIAIACGGTTTEGKDAAVSDAKEENISVALYGTIPVDAGKDTGNNGNDAAAPPYGITPMDSGND